MRDWLVEIRAVKGFTQKDVAKLCDISRSFYADIERGFRNPKVDTAMLIGNALGFEWTLFFEQKGRKMSHKERKSA